MATIYKVSMTRAAYDAYIAVPTNVLPLNYEIFIIDAAAGTPNLITGTGTNTPVSGNVGGTSGGGTIFEEWAANTAYAIGDKVIATVTVGAIGAGARLRRNTAGTSGPTFNSTEAAKWTELVIDDDVIPKTDIADNLTTSDATKVLSAKQGKDLQDTKSATTHNHDTAYTAIAHGTNVSNPHSVTKTQVNLGNCDNVSDINKPVSTAQQTALDGKHELYSLGHPYATAATTYGHTVTTSSQYNADYAGWKAFQQNPSSISEWATLGSMAGLLLLELPSLVIFTRCALRGRAGDYPTRWKLEGSNDGSTFTTLLDKTAADESLQYSLGEKVFDFTNTVPYKFYRFNFTAWVGSNAGLNSIRWSHQGINILSNASLTDGSVSAQFDELRFDRVRLISNTDLNVLAVSGFYDGTNLTNAPGASTSWFYVEHLQHSNVVAPGWAMQKAYGLGSPNSGTGAAGTMYIRTLVNAVWQAWRTVTTT